MVRLGRWWGWFMGEWWILRWFSTFNVPPSLTISSKRKNSACKSHREQHKNRHLRQHGKISSEYQIYANCYETFCSLRIWIDSHGAFERAKKSSAWSNFLHLLNKTFESLWFLHLRRVWRVCRIREVLERVCCG